MSAFENADFRFGHKADEKITNHDRPLWPKYSLLFCVRGYCLTPLSLDVVMLCHDGYRIILTFLSGV